MAKSNDDTNESVATTEQLARPTDSEIKKLKRSELNQLGAEYGLNPDDYAKVDDLRSAIFAYLQANPETNAEAEAPAASEDDEPELQAKKGPKPNPPRSRLERRSKRYKVAHEKIDKSKSYSPAEAVDLAKSTSTTKFDEMVELHINLGVDPKQADQLVRGTLVLPHGSGKTKRVAVLAPENEHTAAKKAGADVVGADDLLEKIGKNIIEFDILVAHPEMMKNLGKYAKTLGPQGLMPSPKAGTVSTDVAKTVSELKGGRIEYRVDRYGIIHQAIGRVSFTSKQLTENATIILQAIKAAKPSSSKGIFIKTIVVTTSMGPSIKVDPSQI